MRRDPEIIRALLLRLESIDIGPGGVRHIYPSDEALAIDGENDARKIASHLEMISDAGLILPENSTAMHGVMFSRLSPAGHDFVDAVRDPAVWRKTKAAAENAGSFTLDILKDLGIAFARSAAAKITGMDL